MHRAQHGEGQHDQVVKKRPEKVLPDFGEGRPAEVHGLHDGVQPPPDQDNVAGFDRHIRAGADRQSHLRLRQGGGVVDAVAHHGHDFPLLLQTPHRPGLVRRQHPRDNLLNAHCPRNRPRRALVVARQHHRRHPAGSQRGDRRLTARFDRVGHGNNAGHPAIHRDHHGGFGLIFQAGQGLRHGIRYADAQFIHPGPTAGGHRPARNLRADAAPRPCRKIRRRRGRNPPAARQGDDGRAQRVLGIIFRAGGQPQQFRLVQAMEGLEVGDGRLAGGDGAGFVENDGRHILHRLDGGAPADQDAALGAEARSDHQRRGRGQAQRAGTGHDQDGDGRVERQRHRPQVRINPWRVLRRPRRHAGKEIRPGQPRRQGQTGQQHHRRHKNRRDAVGQLLHRHLGSLSLLHQPDHLS